MVRSSTPVTVDVDLSATPEAALVFGLAGLAVALVALAAAVARAASPR